MNKFTIIPILILIMSAITMADMPSDLDTSKGFDCYIRVSGGSCVRITLPADDEGNNWDFCAELSGDSIPGQTGSFTTGIIYVDNANNTQYSPSASDFDYTDAQDLTPTPEFGTIGAGIALVGSIGAYLKRRKAIKNV